MADMDNIINDRSRAYRRIARAIHYLSENREVVPEGTPDNPADLPMGITEPITEPVSQEKNAAPSDDDNEIELMLEGGELEGIEPLESGG